MPDLTVTRVTKKYIFLIIICQYVTVNNYENRIKHPEAKRTNNFIKNNYGRIINISSTVGINGNIGQSNYAASKAGIIGLSKSIAKELGRKNVTCNVIAPGFIETDMTSNLKNKQEILRNIPLNKFGTVEDVAFAAAFLASDEAKYITGSVIKVDGGLIL